MLRQDKSQKMNEIFKNLNNIFLHSLKSCELKPLHKIFKKSLFFDKQKKLNIFFLCNVFGAVLYALKREKKNRSYPKFFQKFYFSKKHKYLKINFKMGGGGGGSNILGGSGNSRFLGHASKNFNHLST